MILAQSSQPAARPAFARLSGYGALEDKAMPSLHLLPLLLALTIRPPSSPVHVYPARVLESYPHDADAFTQGLHLEEDGTLIESTGLYGESTVRRVDVESGRLLHCERLPGAWFGEGVTVQAGRCIQLLWREGLLLVRDARTLKLRDTVALPSGISEGWGITGDGAGSLFVSDGSDILHELDAHSARNLHSLAPPPPTPAAHSSAPHLPLANHRARRRAAPTPRPPPAWHVDDAPAPRPLVSRLCL